MKKQELVEVLKSYGLISQSSDNKRLFADYLEKWLESHRKNIRVNTYNSYFLILKKHLLPYYYAENIKLCDIKPHHIQDYYDYKSKGGMSNNTILKHHAIIHKALKTACKAQLIFSNSASLIERPKLVEFHAKYYDTPEINECLSAFVGSEIELAVIFAVLLGLRRSEVLGLTWDCINLNRGTFMIKRTVVNTEDAETGKHIQLIEEKTKTQSSRRTLGLPEFVLKKVREARQKRAYNMAKNADVYNMQYVEYLFVNEFGTLLKPDYLSKKFHDTLIQNNLEVIRFHDLRHSCATMLLDLGYNLKDIQEWLGHSTVETTVKYLHFTMKNKMQIANKIDLAVSRQNKIAE